MKIYIETTIPSYLVARPARDLLQAARQQISADWWKTHRPFYENYISQVVFEEIQRGDVSFAAKRIQALAGIEVLATTSEVIDFASAIVKRGILPIKAEALRRMLSILPLRQFTEWISYCHGTFATSPMCL